MQVILLIEFMVSGYSECHTKLTALLENLSICLTLKSQSNAQKVRDIVKYEV